MPVQSMSCPKCGKPASEYSPNKWQCLSCQTKFVYETPPEVSVQQHRLELVTDGLSYQCGLCGLQFSKMLQPANECTACHKTLCPECFGLNAPLKKRRGPGHAKLCLACSPAEGQAWYHHPVWILVLAFVALGPIALLLVWTSTKISRAGKVFMAVLILAYTGYCTYFLYRITAFELKFLSDFGDVTRQIGPR